MNKIKKYYKEQLNKFSLFERFLINTGLIVLFLLILFKWFVNIRLTVMEHMKPDFRYRDYVMDNPM